MDKKHFAYIFVAYIIALSFYTYYNNETIVSTISGNGLQGIVYYFFANPAYVLLMATLLILNKDTNFIRNITATLFILTSADILSYPRLGTSISNDINLLASSDGIAMSKMLSLGLEYSTAYTIYYLILPIVLIILSLWLLGINEFYKKLIGHKNG